MQIQLSRRRPGQSNLTTPVRLRLTRLNQETSRLTIWDLSWGLDSNSGLDVSMPTCQILALSVLTPAQAVLFSVPKCPRNTHLEALTGWSAERESVESGVQLFTSLVRTTLGFAENGCLLSRCATEG